MANRLELRVTYQVLLAFAQVIGGGSGLLKMDVVTAVAYIKKQGGMQSLSLLEEVEPIISWAQENLLRLSAVYIPGHVNLQVDYLPRPTVDNNEWSLLTQVFRELVAWSFLPEVDLFASLVNAKLPRFCTNWDHPRATLVDALTAKRDFQTAYTFPTVPLILFFLNRLGQEDIMVLTVIPDWPKRR